MKLKPLILLILLCCSFLYFIPIQTVKAVSITITLDAPNIMMQGIGGTPENPITFWHFWNASDANGWGTADKSSFSNYYDFSFLTGLRIGDGSTETYFIDTNTNVFFDDTYFVASTDVLEIKNNAYFRIGMLVDATTKRTSDGCSILLDSNCNTFLDNQDGAESYVYGCLLNSIGTGKISNVENLTIYESTLTNLGIVMSSSETDDYYRNIITGGTNGLGNPLASGTFDELLIHSCTQVVLASGSTSPTVRELKARNNTKLLQANFWSGNAYIIDADVDSWVFGFLVSTGEVLRQYSYDLNVNFPNGTDLNGTATGARILIQHYGQGGAVDYNATLGEDGTIPTQTLTMGFYNQTGGDTLYDYNPYNLQVTNVTGYQDINFNFTLNRKRDSVKAMYPEQLEEGFITGLGIGLVFTLIIACIGFAVKLKRR